MKSGNYKNSMKLKLEKSKNGKIDMQNQKLNFMKQKKMNRKSKFLRTKSSNLQVTIINLMTYSKINIKNMNSFTLN